MPQESLERIVVGLDMLIRAPAIHLSPSTKTNARTDFAD
jgi:hypothetical protein